MMVSTTKDPANKAGFCIMAQILTMTQQYAATP